MAGPLPTQGNSGAAAWWNGLVVGGPKPWRWTAAMPSPSMKPRVLWPNMCAPKATSRLDAVNDALAEIASRDPGFFVIGQDVGSPRGGVFGTTQSLVSKFPGTAISSPLNEQLIFGIAAGASMVDGRARCGEIQFIEYHQSMAQTVR